ncbi:unnamed protein product [Dibothriocephalus latus]|uniref:VIT domain-containing protein n=1 Tax=Dibothriocephalus latus TaxID=60516 RepID=A0A3P7MR01_DIBLA|nr:unnamed protein product [Dibothriocephalus latus]
MVFKTEAKPNYEQATLRFVPTSQLCSGHESLLAKSYLKMFCTYGNTFGLKNVGDYPPTAIPLQSVQVNTSIINATADVVCNFAFRNDSDKTLETEFSFPLDSDSAVYHFEAKIGEKRLIAKCRERVEDRHIAKAKRDKFPEYSLQAEV